MPGLKHKDLMMMPARVALALQADGWWLRSEIIWHKPNPMPESVRDRPTSAHEKVFLMSKSARYFYDADAVRVAPAQKTAHPGNSVNLRNVLESRDARFQRRTLRHLSPETDRAVHQDGHERPGLLCGVRGRVGAGGV